MTEGWKQWEGEVVDGRFLLRRFLSSSDHSAVFLTECGDPPQKAALKFVEANPATAQQLLSRWERATKLTHPHLLRLLQSGSCQLGRASMLYVITEFAEENLSQILPTRPLSPVEAEYMLRSVLEVLAYLHGQGVVHGRMKPSNILAVAEQLKISSDGLCAHGDRALAGPATIYDPPELATTGLSAAGDVWSLGITLVEVLTQRPSVGEGIRQGDPSLAETVPPPFLEIVRQCLRLDPQRRWTVPDIAARLLPTAPVPRKNSVSKYLLPAALIAVALGGLVAGPKLLNRRPEPRTSPSTALQPGSLPPAAGQQPTTPAVSPPPSPSDAETQKPKEPTTQTPSPALTVPEPPVHTSGAASVPGSVAQEVVPRVSQRSRDTITGTVRVGVRVSVDVSGKVVEAKIDSQGPSAYFAKLALESSRRWKFTPPQENGAAVPSEWILHYEFGQARTQVHSSQVPTPK